MLLRSSSSQVVKLLLRPTAAASQRALSTGKAVLDSAREQGVKMVFMGAPGSGKGTFASRIAPAFGIPTVSTGDLVRAEIKAGSALGSKIEALNAQGMLVPDEIITEMAQQRLAKDDAQRGFILDGFPRTIGQALALDEFADLDLVLNVGIDEGVLVLKTVSRRVCEDCGNGYNVASIDNGYIKMDPLLPEVEGVCDRCQGKLIQREDDTEEVVRRRLEVYHEETAPLIEHYRKRGLLVEFQVLRGVADTPNLIHLLADEAVARQLPSHD